MKINIWLIASTSYVAMKNMLMPKFAFNFLNFDREKFNAKISLVAVQGQHLVNHSFFETFPSKSFQKTCSNS